MDLVIQSGMKGGVTRRRHKDTTSEEVVHTNHGIEPRVVRQKTVPGKKRKTFYTLFIKGSDIVTSDTLFDFLSHVLSRNRSW